MCQAKKKKFMYKTCIFYSFCNLQWKFDVKSMFPAKCNRTGKNPDHHRSQILSSIYHRHKSHDLEVSVILTGCHFHGDRQIINKKRNMICML